MLAEASFVLVDKDAVSVAEAFVDPEIVEVTDPEATGAAADRIKPAIEAARAGKTAVRLMAGDPMLGSALIGEVGAVRRAKMDIEIVPAVSSVTGVPAYAGYGLTGGKAREVRIIDAEDSGVHWEELTAPRVTAVFPSGANHLVHIARALLDAGKPAATPVAVTPLATPVLSVCDADAAGASSDITDGPATPSGLLDALFFSPQPNRSGGSGGGGVVVSAAAAAEAAAAVAARRRASQGRVRAELMYWSVFAVFVGAQRVLSGLPLFGRLAALVGADMRLSLAYALGMVRLRLRALCCGETRLYRANRACTANRGTL